MKADFDKQLSGMALDHLMCRTFGHKFDPAGSVELDKRRRTLAIGLACTRCGYEKDRIISSLDGHRIITRSAGYPDGYLFKGTGRLSPEERGIISLTVAGELG
jgi:hypothetical protein